MKRTIVVYIATSVDGFIATLDDSLEWLLNAEGEGDNGYKGFYNTVDTIVMGRRTYEWILDHEDGRWPYQGKMCYVFSRTIHGTNNEATFIDGNVGSFIREDMETLGETIWVVGGGDIIHEFLREDLVDEMILCIAPVILGSGIPLFRTRDKEMELRLKSITRYNQMVELHYVRK